MQIPPGQTGGLGCQESEWAGQGKIELRDNTLWEDERHNEETSKLSKEDTVALGRSRSLFGDWHPEDWLLVLES